jgi:hypothetical protein
MQFLRGHSYPMCRNWLSIVVSLTADCLQLLNAMSALDFGISFSGFR